MGVKSRKKKEVQNAKDFVIEEHELVTTEATYYVQEYHSKGTGSLTEDIFGEMQALAVAPLNTILDFLPRAISKYPHRRFAIVINKEATHEDLSKSVPVFVHPKLQTEEVEKLMEWVNA